MRKLKSKWGESFWRAVCFTLQGLMMMYIYVMFCPVWLNKLNDSRIYKLLYIVYVKWGRVLLDAQVICVWCITCSDAMHDLSLWWSSLSFLVISRWKTWAITATRCDRLAPFSPNNPACWLHMTRKYKIYNYCAKIAIWVCSHLL